MEQPIDVEMRDVVKRFGETVAVDRVSLRIARGEFFSLLGPSGCGKTTTLRMIAGFEIPTTGEICIERPADGQDAAVRRNVNTVFQNYALFPHMTVAENVAFGLQMSGVPRPRPTRRVAEALEMVRLDGYGEPRGRGSSPAASSSGWRWRARWSTGRPCCCSTSRSARSTSSCARRCSSS